jgi:hypothetical protein
MGEWDGPAGASMADDACGIRRKRYAMIVSMMNQVNVIGLCRQGVVLG